MSSAPLLEVDDLSKAFDGVIAVKSVSFSVKPGEIYAIVGPNGAGKTTAINLMTGVYKPDTGKVLYDGKNLIGMQPNQVISQGIARTFQNVRVFGNMTVLENVMVGCHRLVSVNLFDVILSLPKARNEERSIRAKSLAALEMVGLIDRAHEPADLLPLGMQKMLELARSLVSEPKLLLLDEPAAGLNDAETEALGKMLRRIRDQGITILLIEHHMPMVMSISDRIVVLNYGEKIAEGTPREIRMNPDVIAAYLGQQESSSD